MSEQICGKCMMPIHEAETGLRHYGHFTAHSENRCLEILRDSLAAAQRVVEAAQELKIRWCTAGQGNTDEAMDALFDLLPESTP